MSINGFRVNSGDGKHYVYFEEIPRQFHTGTYDCNGASIYEGDFLRSKSCEIPFKVENIVSFLIMCGKYEAQHGVPIFESLEIVN
jgi:hypothetical protein